MPGVQLDHSAHLASGTSFPICLLACDIDVPMNVGSLFRIADALGVEKIFLCGSSLMPPNTKIRKTSRATEKYVAHEYTPEPMLLIERLRQQGYRIISLEITSASVDIADFDIAPNDRICLLLGSESTGVPQALLDASDASVHIPMLGHNSSLNVASACAIAIYEFTRKMDL